MDIAADDDEPERDTENEAIIRQMHKDAKEILAGRPKRFLPEKTANSESIDLTPTWRTVADVIVILMEDGTLQGKEEARGFLYDMARVADAHVAEKKEEAKKKASVQAAMDSIDKIPDWGS